MFLVLVGVHTQAGRKRIALLATDGPVEVDERRAKRCHAAGDAQQCIGSWTAQRVVGDAGRRRQRCFECGRSHANGHIGEEPVGELTLPVDIETIETQVARIDRAETAHVLVGVEPDRLAGHRQAEGVVGLRRGRRIGALRRRGAGRERQRGEEWRGARQVFRSSLVTACGSIISQAVRTPDGMPSAVRQRRGKSPSGRSGNLDLPSWR